MGLYRIVAQFVGGGNSAVSWSETMYRSENSLADASNFGVGMFGARVALLHPLYTLKKVRISDVANPRVSTIDTLNFPGTYPAGVSGGSGGLIRTGPTEPDVACVVSLASAVVPAKRKIALRGLAESAFEYSPLSGTVMLESYFQSRLTAWIKAVDAQRIVIAVRHKASEDGFHPLQIVSVDGSGGKGTSLITLSAQPDMIKGQQVIIQQTSPKDLPGLNGTWVLLDNPVGSTVKIAYETPLDQLITLAKGSLRKLTYIPGAYISKDLSQFDHIGSRKSRSPFTGGVGRRRSPLKGLRTLP